MKTRMKRILTLFLAAVMAVSPLTNVKAQEDVSAYTADSAEPGEGQQEAEKEEVKEEVKEEPKEETKVSESTVQKADDPAQEAEITPGEENAGAQETVNIKELTEAKMTAVKNQETGKTELRISTTAKTFDQLYVGNKEDETKEPVIKGTENAGGGYDFILEITDAQPGQKLKVVPRLQKSQEWYTEEDVTLTVPAQPEGSENAATGSEETKKPQEEGFVAENGVAAEYDPESGKTGAYSMFKIKKSTAVVKGDKIEVNMWVLPASSGSFTYDAIYIGGKDDATKEPLVMGEEVTVDGEKLEKFSFTVPYSAKGTSISFVPRSKKNGTFSTKTALVLTIPGSFNNLDEGKIAQDGVAAEYDPESGKTGAYSMFKIKKSTAVVKGSNIEVSIWVLPASSGSFTYDAIYIGSKDDATKEPLVMGEEVTVDGEKLEKFSFTVPYSAKGTNISFVPRSKKNGTFSTKSALVLTIPSTFTASGESGGEKPEEPEKPTAPAMSGTDLQIVKSDATPFKMFLVADFTCTKDGDKINITFTTDKPSFDKIYLGYKDDETKNPTIAGSPRANGGWTFTFSVDAASAGKVLPITLGKPNDSWYTSQDLWIYIPPVKEGETPGPSVSDQISAVAGGTGDLYKAFTIQSSTAKLNGDKVDLTLNVTGNGFTRLYLGTQASTLKTPEYRGSYDSEKNITTFSFSVPAEMQGMNIPFTPGTDAAWLKYARDLFINIPNMEPDKYKATTADGTYDLYGNAFTGNTYSLTVERESKVVIKGTQATITIVTQATRYDKIYLGNLTDDAAMKDSKAIVGVERKDIGDAYKSFTFTVPVASFGGQIFYETHDSKADKWAGKQGYWTINALLPKAESTENPNQPDQPGGSTKIPEDGAYETTAETGAAMFKVVAAKLTVKDGKMKALITLSGVGYDYLYMGTGEEAASKTEKDWIKYCGTTTYTDSTTGEVKEGRQYEIPVEALDKALPVASHSESKNKWYDRSITFSSEKLKKITAETLADGTYETTAETGAAMFKVVAAKLTVKDGKIKALITLSGVGYDYLYMGTGEEAASKTEKDWIKYCGTTTYTDSTTGEVKEGRQYEIPVEALDKVLPVASHSESRNKWYDRSITFSSADLKKLSSGNDKDPTKPSDPVKPSNPSKPADTNPDKESKYESDTSGATGKVNSSTTLPDGVYTPDRFSWSGGSGRINITCTKVTVTGGQAYATIIFSSSSYAYVKANGNVYYGTKGAGTSTFVIPVELNKNNQIIGMTTKMSAAHEIKYNIFVYLAAAGGSGAVGNLSTTELSKEAPEIIGLKYESEVETQYAELFKVFRYQDGITLVEVDASKYTADDPDEQEKDTDEKASEEKTDDKAETEETTDTEKSTTETTETVDGEAVAKTAEEITAELYQEKILRYLIVPEGVEVPAGLEKEMIIVNIPAENVYVGEDSVAEQLKDLDLLDLVAATGMKQKECTVKELKEALKKKDVIYTGDYTDLEYKKLVTSKVDLAIFTGEVLPQKEDKEVSSDSDSKKKLTEKEQRELLKDMTERFATLGIPVIVDRSQDEKEELAKAEWIKVYGAIFGKQDEASQLFEKIEKEAKTTDTVKEAK